MVTTTVPLAATASVAVICVAEFTTKPTAKPPTLTAVVVKPVPVKFVPVITSIAPCPAVVGVKFVMLGAGSGVAVKPPNEATPPGVVTVTAPDTAPIGTTAVICVGDTTTKLAAATPPKFTAVAA